MNRAIMTSLAGIAIGQALKVPMGYAIRKQWDWSLLTQTGGMPSSHSAGVASLATYIALKRGLPTIDFALSTIFGMIVMYDAMGIRRHAGEIAVEVNELDIQVERLSKQHPGLYHAVRDKALKEQLGHLPAEVGLGALLGVLVGAMSFVREPKSRLKKSSLIKIFSMLRFN